MDNSVAASPIAHFRGDPWRAMDTMPLAIRRALHEAVVDWCPLWIVWEYRKELKAGATASEAVASIVTLVRAADADDIRDFSLSRPKRHGGRSAHDRAGASPQRYHGDGRARPYTAPNRTT